MEEWTQRRIRIAEIPDPGDLRLATAWGGNVREGAFTSFEQLLRGIATFDPGRVRVAIRFVFDPSVTPRSSRTALEIAVASPDDATLAAAVRLLNSGPVAGLYDSLRGEFEDFGGFSPPEAGVEIVRRQTTWRPEPPKNPEFMSSAFEAYFAVEPFSPNLKNDWSMLDRLLDRFDQPATVELLVEPTGVSEEKASVDVFIQKIDSLTNSRVRSQSEWMARLARRKLEDLFGHFDELHLRFAIRCWAASLEDARLLGSVVAESAFESGAYRVLELSPSSHQDYASRPGTTGKAIRIVDKRDPGDVDCSTVSDELKSAAASRLNERLRLTRLARVEELLGAFRLPIGHAGFAPRTMRRNTDPLWNQNVSKSILVGDDLETGSPELRAWDSFRNDLGQPFSSTSLHHLEIRLELDQLCKHLFLSGVPGSGKTVAVLNLLTQLHRHGIPFLVIEPAKTEYRKLKLLGTHPDGSVRQLAESLRVYTLGNDDVSPFRFNPLWHPEGISRDEHIGTMMSCFEAGMELWGPLPALLAEALDDAYEEAAASGRQWPGLQSLVGAVRRKVAEKGYRGELLSNIQAAIEARLGTMLRGSVGKMFDTDDPAPDLRTLFGSSVILELDSMRTEHAGLMTLFVLSALREHVRVDADRQGSHERLRHVTVIEEAHNIVAAHGLSRAPDIADPGARAAEFVSRMLAEMRALGEGIVIADQLPSAVAPNVVKNTGTKIAFRMVSGDDRATLGDAMLLDDAGRAELARLPVGHAFFYSEGLHVPRQIRTLDASAYLAVETDGEFRLPPPPSRAVLRNQLEREDWYRTDRSRRLQQWVEDARAALRLLRQLEQPHGIPEGDREPIAEILERFWQRAAIARDLPALVRNAELTSDPARARILTERGEDDLARQLRTIIREIRQSIAALRRGLRSMSGTGNDDNGQR